MTVFNFAITITVACATMLIVQVHSQSTVCEDKSSSGICQQRLVEDECNITQVQEMCKKTCGLCITTTTESETTTEAPEITTELELTTLESNTTEPKSASTTTQNSIIVTANSNSTQAPTKTTPVTTLKKSTATPTTTLALKVNELKNAVKVEYLLDVDNDYNMHIFALFLGNVDSSEHPAITKALLKALSKFNVNTEKWAIIDAQYGQSSELSSIKLTMISWKLKVKTKQGENSADIVDDLKNNPRLGYTVEQALPAAVQTSLSGGDNFIQTTPVPVTTTTVKKKKIGTMDQWDVIGITIGTGLAFVLFVIITFVIVRWRKTNRQKMDVAESSYDFEVSVSPTNNNHEDANAKTHL